MLGYAMEPIKHSESDLPSYNGDLPKEEKRIMEFPSDEEDDIDHSARVMEQLEISR
jgi:hypothetical protein